MIVSDKKRSIFSRHKYLVLSERLLGFAIKYKLVLSIRRRMPVSPFFFRPPPLVEFRQAIRPEPWLRLEGG